MLTQLLIDKRLQGLEKHRTEHTRQGAMLARPIRRGARQASVGPHAKLVIRWEGVAFMLLVRGIETGDTLLNVEHENR
jgi:hypothetical protein